MGQKPEKKSKKEKKNKNELEIEVDEKERFERKPKKFTEKEVFHNLHQTSLNRISDWLYQLRQRVQIWIRFVNEE